VNKISSHSSPFDGRSLGIPISADADARETIAGESVAPTERRRAMISRRREGVRVEYRRPRSTANCRGKGQTRLVHYREDLGKSAPRSTALAWHSRPSVTRLPIRARNTRALARMRVDYRFANSDERVIGTREVAILATWLLTLNITYIGFYINMSRALFITSLGRL